jgi:hypothetical protein
MKAIWIAIVVGCPILVAQVRGATTEPAATPEAFVQAYSAALRTQDANALYPFFTTRTPGERAVVDFLIANELDTIRLMAAAEKMFGVKVAFTGSLLCQEGTPPQWKVANREAFIANRSGIQSVHASLRLHDGRYRIEMVVEDPDSATTSKLARAAQRPNTPGGLAWLDTPEAKPVRQFFRRDPAYVDKALRLMQEGRYRTIEELQSAVPNASYLDRAPDSPPGNPPRPFRRPVTLDLSTPQSAIRSQQQALAEGDSEAFLRTFDIVVPRDGKLLKEVARGIDAMVALDEASVRRFGVTIPPAHLISMRASALQTLAKLEEREPEHPNLAEMIVVKGNWAVLDPFGLTELKRVSGEWKFRSRNRRGDLSDYLDSGPEGIRVVQLEEDFARRIDRGEFASAKEASEALDRAALAVLTAPTTQP